MPVDVLGTGVKQETSLCPHKAAFLVERESNTLASMTVESPTKTGRRKTQGRGRVATLNRSGRPVDRDQKVKKMPKWVSGGQHTR